jgi:hypothetical protein
VTEVETIYVVSWVYWNGDEQGGGGFQWLPSRDDALELFEAEKSAWAGNDPARVRLLRVELPAEALECFGNHQVHTPEGLKPYPCPSDSPETCWLEAHLYELEEVLAG